MSPRRQAVQQHPLVGKWFHSFATGEQGSVVDYQGQILAVEFEGVLVQLYEWIVGQAGVLKWLPLEQVHQWDLYDSSEQMNQAWDLKWKHRR